MIMAYAQVVTEKRPKNQLASENVLKIKLIRFANRMNEKREEKR